MLFSLTQTEDFLCHKAESNSERTHSSTAEPFMSFIHRPALAEMAARWQEVRMTPLRPLKTHSTFILSDKKMAGLCAARVHRLFTIVRHAVVTFGRDLASEHG